MESIFISTASQSRKADSVLVCETLQLERARFWQSRQLMFIFVTADRKCDLGHTISSEYQVVANQSLTN